MPLLEGVGIAGPDAFIRTGDAIERQEIVPILPISIDAYKKCRVTLSSSTVG